MNKTKFRIYLGEMDGRLRRKKREVEYDCCKHHLLYAGCMEFHEWDEVFNTEITFLVLYIFQCEFCHESYYIKQEEKYWCGGERGK